MGEIDHEESQVGGIVDLNLANIHEILQAPELTGAPAVELDLEPKPIVLDERIRNKIEIATEQNGMPPSFSDEIELDDNHNVGRLAIGYVI